jgi:acyl-homoserine lactone acylase PvdQ
MPGWTGEHEWEADAVPREELPMEHDPECGYIFSANNRHTDRQYPHYLSFYSFRFRADRLKEIFAAGEYSSSGSGGQPVYTRESMAKMQADTLSIHARQFTTKLLELLGRGERRREREGVASSAALASPGVVLVLSLLSAWAPQADMRPDSAAALAYHEVLAQMIRRLVTPFFERCPAVAPPAWSAQCVLLLDAMLQGSATSVLLVGCTINRLYY